MNGRLVAATAVAMMTLAACASDIHDLRLEAVRPASAMDRTLLVGTPERPHEWGLAAELSSAQDLRRHVARWSDVVFGYIRPCAPEQLAPARPVSDEVWGVVEIFDVQGRMRHAGRRLPNEADGKAPSIGTADGNRFRFAASLPLLVFPPVARSRDYAVIAFDLRAVTEDLCLHVGGSQMFFGNHWRTNAVVIPYSLLRAALDAAPPPDPAPHEPPASARQQGR